MQYSGKHGILQASMTEQCFAYLANLGFSHFESIMISNLKRDTDRATQKSVIHVPFA